MWPAIISAGASLLGNIFGSKSDNKTAEYNAQVQREINAENIALQREFAHNAIQWKVADAREAGVHPVYALGAPTMSPSIAAQAWSKPYTGDRWSNAGRDIGAAVSSYAAKRNNQDLVNLQKEKIRAEIRATNAQADFTAAQAISSLHNRAYQSMNSVRKVPGTKPLYIQVKDNRPGSDGSKMWIPNPDLGFELPETLGAYYYGKGVTGVGAGGDKQPAKKPGYHQKLYLNYYKD